jgi:hypothetical protein
MLTKHNLIDAELEVRLLDVVIATSARGDLRSGGLGPMLDSTEALRRAVVLPVLSS